jgi:CopG family transcriptional regulator/antitoxin EndoAI
VRTTKTWTISLPPKLSREAERAAREENRTKSELLREALRLYLEDQRWRKLQRKNALLAQTLGIRTEEDVDRIVHAVRK